MSKDEKIVNDYLNHKLNEVARKEGRTREEVFNRMSKDQTYRAQINEKIGQAIKGATNEEVREAAKRLRK